MNDKRKLQNALKGNHILSGENVISIKGDKTTVLAMFGALGKTIKDSVHDDKSFNLVCNILLKDNIQKELDKKLSEILKED